MKEIDLEVERKRSQQGERTKAFKKSIPDRFVKVDSPRDIFGSLLLERKDGEVSSRGEGTCSQSTGGSLTSRIESRRYDLVKSILVVHSRSTEHARATNNVGSLTAAEIEGGL